MSDFLGSYIDQKSKAQQSFAGVDGTSDEASRSFQLEQASGVPAEVINQDVDGFDKGYKAKLGGQIIAQNPHLSSFVNSHPLHGQLIADDLSTLDNLTRGMEKLNGKHAAEAGFQGFAERFGKDRIGSYYTSAIGGTKSLENYPILSSIGASVGIPLEVLSRTVSGGVGFLHEFTKQYGQDLGLSEQASSKFANDLAGLAEYELIKPEVRPTEFKPREDLRYNRETGRYGPAEGEILPLEPKPQPPGGLPQPPITIDAEKAPKPVFPGQAWLEAGERPPREASAVYDQLEQQEATQNRQMLDEAFDLAEQTSLKQEAPEKLRELLDRVPNGTLRISAEQLQKIWKPGVGDMFRNVVPDLEQRLQIPYGSITFPTNEFVSHIPKDIYDSLADDIAVGNGLSVNETKELQEIIEKPLPSDRVGPAGEAQQVGNFIASEMERVGRPSDEAQRIGQLAAARYYARGVRLGVSPQALFDQERLSFEGEGANPYGLSFEQPIGYHGSFEDITEPDLTKGGTREGARWNRRNTMFFSPKKFLASDFGTKILEKDIDLSNAMHFDIPKLVEDPKFLEEMEQAFYNDKVVAEHQLGRDADENFINRIVDEWDRIHKPLYIDKSSEAWSKFGDVNYRRYIVSAAINQAREAGSDVAVIKGMFEDPDVSAELQTQWVVLNSRAFKQQGLRGRITFNPLNKVIELFDSANASTPIHEFGHLWTDELFRDAMRPGAPDSIVNARDALLRELGHPAGSVVDSLHLTDADHEQAAKWMEQYLREGEAPSTKLVGIFEEFKKDLLGVYESAAALGQPISSSVRSVFDHMLATDEEIRQRTQIDESALQALRDSGGLSLNIMGYPWAEELPWGQGLVLENLVKQGAPWQEIAANPLVKEFMDRQKELPKTGTKEEARQATWRAKRTYYWNGKGYKGDEIIPKLIEKSMEDAGGEIQYNREMTLVIGPPAAGKSSAVKPMAKVTKSAVVGADEAKDVIPEYRGGVGVYAVHGESLALSEAVLENLMSKGANIIIEKVGNNTWDIIPMIQDWKKLGYKVNLIHVHKPIEELIPGMVSRFQATGRIVDPEYLAGVADKTFPGYQELKPHVDESAAYDTSGSTPAKPILRCIDGEGSRIDAIVRGGKGGDGNAEPTGGVPEAGRKTRSFGQPNDEPPRVFQRAAAFGRTEREYRRYQELIAQRDAEDVEWRRNRAERQAKRENSEEWKAEADKIRDGIKAEVEQRPEVGVYQVFEDGRMKLNRENLSEAQIAALPPKFVSKKGIHPDDVANFFGFTDGGTMIQVLSSMAQAAEGFKGDIIKRLTEAEVFKQVKDKLGESPQQRLEEVTDHALSLTEMEKLHEQVLALGQRMGVELPLSKSQMQWGARELLLQDNFGGMKSSKYLRDSGKAARALEKALLTDDPLEAFKQAQAQFVAANMAKEAVSVEKEKRAFDRVAKRFAKREVNGVSAEYTNWIHDILMRTGRGVARSRGDLNEAIAGQSDSNFRDFLSSKYGMGYEIDVPDFLLDPNFAKPMDSMNVLQARQVMRAVQMLAKAGRAEKKIQVGASKVEVTDFLDQASEQLSLIGEATQLDWKGAYSALRKVGRTFLANSLQIESLLNRFDRGNRFGIFNQFIGRPLFEAANYEAKVDRDTAAEFKKLPKLLNLNEIVPNPLFKDPLSALQKDGSMDWSQARLLQLTRKNLYAILLNAGNTDNLERLATGYGLQPQQVMDWLIDYTDKDDWKWAQQHGKIFEGLKTLSDQMRRRVSGQAPEPVPLFPIQNKYGTFDGWYHPIIHDETFFGRYRGDEGGNALFAKEYIRAGTPEGYTKARTNYRGPLSLSMDAIPGRIYQEIHDIAFREAILNASKIVYNNRFLNNVSKYYGKEYADLFQPWLKDVANSANSNASANQVFETASGFLRQNLIGTLVGLNPRTVQKHTLTALALSMKEVGPADFSTAFFSLLSRGERDTQTNWGFALEKSEELQRRHQNFNEQVAGAQQSTLRSTAAGTFMSFRQALLHASTAPIAFFDLLSAVPTWLAAYKQALEERGNVGDATYAADTAVRRAHGSTAITNRPAIMRGGEIGNWMTSLYTFFNRMANAQYELAWRAKIAAGFAEGKDAEIRDAMSKDSHLWMGLFVYVIVPAVIEEMVTPYTNAERDSWAIGAAKTIGHGLASSWVGVRDFVSAFIEGKDPTLGMAGTDAKTITDLVRDLKKKDFGMDRERAGKTIKHAFTAFGAATGLTNAEEGNVAQFLYDLKTGKAKPRTAGDWWRGLTKGETRQKEDRPDLVERGLRLVGGDKK